MRRKLTITGVTADLRAANAEAAGYLSELNPLRDRVRELEAALVAKQKALEGCDRLCTVLVNALEYYQQGYPK